MDRTIRNLDEKVYRQLKAHAALHDLTIGEAMNQAIEAYLSQQDQSENPAPPIPSPSEGGEVAPEDVSERVDKILYGPDEDPHQES